jgi:hypothetical protein
MPTKGTGKTGPGGSQTDAAFYIATLTEELAEMARSHGLESLRYILEMARVEADQIAKGPDQDGSDAT